jgi:hypothetical protein
MTHQHHISGREVWITVEQVYIPDSQPGQYIPLGFCASFRFDERPGAMLSGEFIKGAAGRAIIFHNEAEAQYAALKQVESSLSKN